MQGTPTMQFWTQDMMRQAPFGRESPFLEADEELHTAMRHFEDMKQDWNGDPKVIQVDKKQGCLELYRAIPLSIMHSMMEEYCQLFSVKEGTPAHEIVMSTIFQGWLRVHVEEEFMPPEWFLDRIRDNAPELLLQEQQWAIAEPTLLEREGPRGHRVTPLGLASPFLSSREHILQAVDIANNRPLREGSLKTNPIKKSKAC